MAVETRMLRGGLDVDTERRGPAEMTLGELRPPRAAPARFGAAGMSSGAWRVKETVPSQPDGAEAMAKGLGWFSIGLGVAEVVAAERIAGYLGMRDKAGVIRMLGCREIATGAGILTRDTPEARAPWVWSRVPGDAMDAAALMPGLSRENPKRDRVIGALAIVGAAAVLDVACGAWLSAGRRPKG